MSQLSLEATNFFSAEWAQQKGLYTNVYSSLEDLDREVKLLAKQLSSYNPEALTRLKETLWEGTSQNIHQVVTTRAPSTTIDGSSPIRSK